MMAAVVAAMTLGELLGPAAGDFRELEVTDLISDSRAVTQGAAFVALPGATSNGLDFAGQAFAAGAAIVIHEPLATPELERAAAALSGPALALPELRVRLGELGRRFYGRAVPAQELIGVTGTNGKTTVAWLVAHALNQLGRPCGYLGTLGYGRPAALESQSLTTPDCLSLHRALAAIGTPVAAIEVSSHALAQDRIAGLDIPVAIFTNLSRDHLDWHGTMDEYFEAKARLFVRPGLRAAVINRDDAYAEALLGRLAPAVQPVTFSSAAASASLRGRVLRSGLDGIVLEVEHAGAKAELQSPLIGAFNAENLLAALGTLLATDVGFEAACAALATAPPPPGRMEVFGGQPAQPVVVVDFAHTPHALERVLAELGSLQQGQLTCVFGCGGERDRGKRRLMGEAAARFAAHIVLTDDNPRGEDPVAIISDIKAGIGRHADLRVQHDRAAAIAEAIGRSRPGDVVLIAGKGHERTQQTGADMRAFDDRAVVRQVLEASI